MSPAAQGPLWFRTAIVQPIARTVMGYAVLSILLRIFGTGLSYLANVLISRLLGLHGYGEYAIALGWALLLTIPARIGFDNSSLRYATLYFEGGEAGRLRGFITTAISAVAGASVLFAGAMVILGSHALNGAERPVLAWAALLIPPLALLGLLSPMMRTARKIFASQFYDQVLRPLLIIVAVGGAAAAGARVSPSGAMMATTLAAAGALVCLSIHFLRLFSPAIRAPADFSASRQWFALSLPMLAIGAMQELMNQMEVILLGALADSRQAGLFAASWRLASLISFVLVVLATVSGPMIASAYHRGARHELHDISKLVARVGFGFALAAALLFTVTGKWLLGLFGPEFPAAYPVLLILVGGALINAFTGLVAYLLTLTGRERPALIMFAGALAVSAGLNLLLIPRLGAIGAAGASSSATAAWNLAMLIYVRRTIGIDASAIGRTPKHA